MPTVKKNERTVVLRDLNTGKIGVRGVSERWNKKSMNKRGSVGINFMILNRRIKERLFSINVLTRVAVGLSDD